MLTLPHNKVGVEPLYDPDFSESGKIIIPESAKERCDQGVVKYIGKDVTLVRPGDHVLFSGYTGTLIQIQYEGKLIIMPEEFITCVILDDPTDVAGLYFKAKDGSYFQATYEQSMWLMARALEKVTKVGPTRKRHKIEGRPTNADYAKLK